MGAGGVTHGWGQMMLEVGEVGPRSPSPGCPSSFTNKWVLADLQVGQGNIP